MTIYLTEMTAEQFTGEDKEQFQQELNKKIPTFIDNNFYRIKPIHSLDNLTVNTYELRLHIAKKDYRVAFALQNETIIVFFISKELQKVRFEKEIKKWVQRHPAFLTIKEEI